MQRPKGIIPVSIENELKQSYLDYAMSVIVGRALPDVRDGLKPVHRRVLFAMRELGNDWNKPYKKSARVVGDVIGKYHPHGDTAVYDTIVRMAQPFSMRYLLVDGQGNFGSVDGDPPAAMRYTEVKMSKLAHSLLADLDKETVDFAPNYDETEFCPTVLPTRIPNLLVNGSSGIAVGMATNIPTHNLGEIIDGCRAVLADPEISLEQLMGYIKGPDFPTAGIINGSEGIISAYRTGRGRIYVRARTEIEENQRTGKQSIIVTELPYQVNKARLIEKIAELVKEKRIEGIVALRDESNKEGMRVVIEVRKGESAEIILNKLYSYTQLQTVYGINMVALIDGQPKIFNLKQLLQAFLRHRREVVTRRTLFDLRKTRDRAHILEGLAIALANIDNIINLIKKSASPLEAKEKLLAQDWQAGLLETFFAGISKEDLYNSKPLDLDPELGLRSDKLYKLSPVQAQAILDLRLHRLTGLEQDKIIKEYESLLLLIKDLLDILNNRERLLKVIDQELLEVKTEFADGRRTEIQNSQNDIVIEDLIEQEDVVVTLSHRGYVKYQSLNVYQTQKRGGRGKAATTKSDEDFVDKLLIANTHDTILCFSSKGKVYWLKVYQLPQASRMARGRPIVNLLPLDKDEKVNAILPLKASNIENGADHFIVMATSSGLIKKTCLAEFSRPRASGIIAVDLLDNDKLIDVSLTDGSYDIMLFSDSGKAIRFSEEAVRAMGRTARGVRGIKLSEDQQVIALITLSNNQANNQDSNQTDATILTATENGFGKRTAISQYPIHNRGGQGVIAIATSVRNGKAVSAIKVSNDDELMLISGGGTLVRTEISGISEVGRTAQGVRLINLSNNEKLVSVARIEE
ncbi:MAG: DNA gyrase subunit A [Gammaproteobacteria bacterium]|nr:DNA gyrase subunit A [Gammaproteobacteria bacterium]